MHTHTHIYIQTHAHTYTYKYIYLHKHSYIYTVLHHTALHCTTQLCFALHCTAKYCIALHCILLPYACSVLNYIVVKQYSAVRSRVYKGSWYSTALAAGYSSYYKALKLSGFLRCYKKNPRSVLLRRVEARDFLTRKVGLRNETSCKVREAGFRNA